MKKILIISYYWPPSGGSGVQRWLKTSKYLPEFGWQPIIYTPENPDFGLQDESLVKDIHPDVRVIKTKIFEPYSILRFFKLGKNLNSGLVENQKKQSLKKRTLNFIRGNFFIPDPRVFWVKKSIRHLEKLIKEEGIEHVVTTGPPHSIHMIGLGIKRALDVKWIADFRDPFSQLDFLDNFRVTNWARKKYERIEKEVLHECDVVMCTSPSMPTKLLPFDHQKIHVMTNGFDHADFEAQTQASLTGNENYIIYHAGLINNLRFPINLFGAVNELVAKGCHLQLHLVGNVSGEVQQYLNQHPSLSAITKLEGYKSHDEILSDYKKATHLLLLVNNSDNSKVNIPGKLFEYLASQKPIIAIGDREDDAIVIAKDLGHISFDYSDNIRSDDLLNALQSKSDVTHPKNYSRKSLTEVFVRDVLEKD